MQDQPNNHLQDIESDQLQRGTVLGPPESPQGVKSDSQAQREDRLRKMERRLEDMNLDLQSRVKQLEGCECVRQRCVYEGREMVDGQRWQTDINTLCSCTSGRVTCQLHWFSGCPLGSAPVTCPDLCQDARCRGYPEAVCHMHNCGSCFIEWHDPTTGNHVICHDW
uniref:VWFC domain-containing protein n=1 Tax=Acanthochromis polyacanthus TaxID=80966 RepID=A0A3Q1F499_9TELE